ncbi:MAG: hypothetical protein MK175_01935 [Pseudoalteromonas sp.]|uniref:hypothetical protein n=1 Tax=Pseudoalteromonas sp. TaxID=53249 RepID=UPI0025DB82F4|nr:hypothetical protein [Pseudoalteromonas sp.]MCH2085918.1 hypothetical protein [Pseudoalteromonas sp.]
MEKVIHRIVRRLFPELTNQLHLPRWGKVVALPELPTEDGERGSDPFYPRYAVDVQLLDENGTETKSKVLQAVPLPLPGAGDKAGRLEPPALGSIVELGFAYGRADKPFVRTILPFGWDLPAIKEGETRTQVREGVYRHIDEQGNFENKTDKSLNDIIGDLAQLECKTRKVIASTEQEYKSPKTWVGSDSENVLKLLSELMATVRALANTCATHTHKGVATGTGITEAPEQAGEFSSQASEAYEQKSRLDPITK